MPEYLAPGVYVEETSFRQKTIEGVSTSVAAIVGPTRFGQMRGQPVQCTSLADFENNFGDLGNLALGGITAPNYTALSVRAFFDNGGHTIYVARVAHNAAAATATAPRVLPQNTAASVLFQARFPGSGGNLDVVFAPRRSASLLSLSPSTSDADIVLLRLSQVRKAQLNTPAAGLADALFPLQKLVALAQHSRPTRTTRPLRIRDRPEDLHRRHHWRRIFSTSPASRRPSPPIKACATARRAALNQAGLGDAPLFTVPGGPALAQYLGATSTPASYATVNADGSALTFTHALNSSIATDAQLPTALAAADLAPGPGAAGPLYHNAFDISVQRNGLSIYGIQGVSLEFNAPVSLGTALPMNPARSSDRLTQPIAVSYGGPAHNASDVWAALDNAFDPALRVPANPASTPQLVIHLTNGTDGTAPTVADYTGEMNDQLGSYGLAALEDIQVVSMVLCPAAAADPATHLGVVVAMQQHCNKMRYRMGIIEAGQGSSVADVQAFRAQLSDTRLALYYPWVKAASPDGSGDVVLPPSGSGGDLCRYRRAAWRAQGAGERGDSGRDRPRTTSTRSSRSAEPGRHQLPAPVPQPWLPRVGWPHAVGRSGLALRECAALLHVPGTLDRQLDAMGRVRAKWRGTVGQCDGHRVGLPLLGMAQRTSARLKARPGLFRALRPHHHDAERSRQRQAGLPGRRRTSEARRIRHFPHRPEDRRRLNAHEGVSGTCSFVRPHTPPSTSWSNCCPARDTSRGPVSARSAASIPRSRWRNIVPATIR
jgi:hypothetical protein